MRDAGQHALKELSNSDRPLNGSALGRHVQPLRGLADDMQQADPESLRDSLRTAVERNWVFSGNLATASVSALFAPTKSLGKTGGHRKAARSAGRMPRQVRLLLFRKAIDRQRAKQVFEYDLALALGSFLTTQYQSMLQ